MWKAWLLTALISASLTLLVGQKSFSYPVPQVPNPGEQNPTSTKVENLRVDEPVCYMRTEDGRVIDMRSLCDKTPSNTAKPNTYNGYNFAAMKKFDDELYGAGKSILTR